MSPPPTLRPCPIVGCARRVGPRQIMCPDHWAFVPEETRATIRAHKGQLDGGSEHAAAVAEAIRVASVGAEVERERRAS